MSSFNLCFQIVMAIIIAFIVEAFVFRIQTKRHAQEVNSKYHQRSMPIC